MTSANDTIKLLAVDDDRASAELVARVASRKGYEVMSTTEPAEVSTLIETWQPDVLSLDICMPELDAIEVIAILSEANFQGKLIFISGQSERMRNMACKLASIGGVAVAGNFRKPFDIQELGTLLNALQTSH